MLHVLRFKREALPELIDALNATGYALTGGAHSRIDATIELVSGRLAAGNIYINRNIIGAVVGVQPFGGHASLRHGAESGRAALSEAPARERARRLAAAAGGRPRARRRSLRAGAGATRPSAISPSSAPRSRAPRASGSSIELPGPVGERNLYSLIPRGTVLCDAASEAAMIAQDRLRARGGQSRRPRRPRRRGAARRAAAGAANRRRSGRGRGSHRRRADRPRRRGACSTCSRPWPPARGRSPASSAIRPRRCAAATRPPLDFLVNERSICINTTAAGGNASLMTIG